MSTEDPTYNEACAEVYDQWFGSCEDAAVDLLAELAGTGRVLELGIGSGLLALPTQEEQVRCFQNVAAHLPLRLARGARPDGAPRRPPPPAPLERLEPNRDRP